MTKEQEYKAALKLKQMAIHSISMAYSMGQNYFDEYIKENEMALRVIFGTVGKSGPEDDLQEAGL
jgi:hypothetical protein